MRIKTLLPIFVFGVFTAGSSSSVSHSNTSISSGLLAIDQIALEEDPITYLKIEHQKIKNVVSERIENQIKLDSLLTIKKEIIKCKK